MFNSVNNFFPDELAKKLYDYVKGLNWSYGWRSNFNMGYGHWNNDIARAGTFNGLDVESDIDGVVKEAWDFIKENYLPDHILIRCYSNAHTYGVEGYPHTDSRREHDTTIVVYMNKNWKREWGGETMLYVGDVIEHAELPSFNKALMFKGNQWHCARGVTRICPEQRLTLMFKAAKIGVDVNRDNLQIFLTRFCADSIKHKNGSLLNHLLTTYDILKEVGADTHVCLAGGTHSVFGTNAFRQICVPEGCRGEVEECIGTEALRLVDLFGTIDRPKTLTENLGKNKFELRLTSGGVIEVDEKTFHELVILECANLIEQSFLSKNKQLKEYWENFKNAH
jgi:hypothetical protein